MNLLSAVHRPPTQRTRQRIVLVYAVGLSLVFLVSLLKLVFQSAGAVWAALLGLYWLGVGLTLYGGWQLGRSGLLGLPQGRGEHLDERQQARLSGAMAAAYRLLSLLLVLLLVAFLLLGEDLLARLRASQAGVGLAFVVLWLIPFLPNALLAWTEPDLRGE